MIPSGPPFRHAHHQSLFASPLFSSRLLSLILLLLLALFVPAISADTLKTVGAYPCSAGDQGIITVSDFTFVFDRASNNVTYNVEGNSAATVPIIAHITITAYGNELLNERVNLCNENVTELCPVPQGHVSTSGVHRVPANYTEAISTIAYKIPDIEGTVTIQIFNASNPAQNLGCFSSSISNGVSTDIAAVKFLTIGLAAAALVVSTVSSAANSASSGAGAGAGAGAGTGAGAGAGHGAATAMAPHLPITGAEGHAVAGGATTAAPTSGPGTNVAAGGFHAPGFIEFFTVMQSIAISGMYSVHYPQAYRSFTQNMGWSTGVITWAGMQHSIDQFRSQTGGNLTTSNFTRLQQTTLIFGNQTSQEVTSSSLLANTTSAAANSTDSETRRLMKRWAYEAGISTSNIIFKRDANTTSTDTSNEKRYVSIVSGIKAYVESLTIPDTNTFMTLLIWWAIIVAACIAGILSFKLFLELWCLRNTGKRSRFEGFRQRYWLFLGSTLVRIITLLYGVWVLYCLYQFKIADSWGVKLLAGLTLGIFTLVLLLYAARICFLAYRAKREPNGLEILFSHKPWIRKYGLFYDQFKVKFWWAFIPVFLASFGRNAFLALGYGNGLVQIVGQLVIDILLCLFFAVALPFNTKMGNGINLSIQIVRVISLIFLLVFTVQLNVNRIAVTGIGMALIVIQAVLAVVLALLIFTNAVLGVMNMTCGKRLRLRRERKQQAKLEKKRLKAEASNRNLLHDMDEKRVENSSVEYSSYASSEPSNSTPQSPDHVLISRDAAPPASDAIAVAPSTPATESKARVLVSANETPEYKSDPEDGGFIFTEDVESDHRGNYSIAGTHDKPVGGWKRHLTKLGAASGLSKKKSIKEEPVDSGSQENLSRLSATSQAFGVFHNGTAVTSSYTELQPPPAITSTGSSSEEDRAGTTDSSSVGGTREEEEAAAVGGVKQRSVNPKTIRSSLTGTHGAVVAPMHASFGDENNMTIDSATGALSRSSVVSTSSGVSPTASAQGGKSARPFSMVSAASSQFQHTPRNAAPPSGQDALFANPFADSTDGDLISAQQALLIAPGSSSLGHHAVVPRPRSSSVTFAEPASGTITRTGEIPESVQRQMSQEIDKILLPPPPPALGPATRSANTTSSDANVSFYSVEEEEEGSMSDVK